MKYKESDLRILLAKNLNLIESGLELIAEDLNILMLGYARFHHVILIVSFLSYWMTN